MVLLHLLVEDAVVGEVVRTVNCPAGVHAQKQTGRDALDPDLTGGHGRPLEDRELALIIVRSVDGPVGQQLQIAVLDVQLDLPVRTGNVRQIGGSLVTLQVGGITSITPRTCTGSDRRRRSISVEILVTATSDSDAAGQGGLAGQVVMLVTMVMVVLLLRVGSTTFRPPEKWEEGMAG